MHCYSNSCNMSTTFIPALLFYCLLAVKTVVHGSHSGIHERLQCDCGLANEVAPKIIGGNITTPHKYPWMVLVNTDFGSCGGALISRQYVLTAAHCVYNFRNISVGIAVHHREKPGQIVEVYDVKIHPKYKDKPEYDVALIKLERGVDISERVRTLCLPHNLLFERPGKKAILAGWGKTKVGNETRTGSQYLKEVNLKIVSADMTIKAKGLNRDSACLGDSGSPLFTKYSDGRFHVIGVTSTSTGTPPCTGGSEYARVSLLKEWIVPNIMNSEPCETTQKLMDPSASNYL